MSAYNQYKNRPSPQLRSSAGQYLTLQQSGPKFGIRHGDVLGKYVGPCVSEMDIGLYNLLIVVQSFRKLFKGIVSRDFEGLQLILMDRIRVPDVPLEVHYFLNLHLHIAF